MTEAKALAVARSIVCDLWHRHAEPVHIIRTETTTMPAVLLREHGSGRLMFLKQFPNYRPLATSIALTRVREQLEKAGANVPALIRTADDDLWIQHPVFTGVLQDWIDGRLTDPHDHRDWHELFAQHTRFLELSAGIEREDFDCLDDAARVWDTPYGFSRLLSRLEQACELRHRDRLVEVRSVVARVEALCLGVDWDALPLQYVHGDPSPHNGVRADDKVYLIDLDDLRWTYRSWDLARLLVQCAVAFDAPCVGPEIVIDSQLLRIGYKDICGWQPMTLPERSSMASLAALALVSGAISAHNMDSELLGLDAPSAIDDPMHICRTLKTIERGFHDLDAATAT